MNAGPKLRLYRTFKWVRAPFRPGEEPRYGGPPRPFVLEHTDTLQFRQGVQWLDVPVVEAETPPKPEQRNRFGRVI